MSFGQLFSCSPPHRHLMRLLNEYDLSQWCLEPANICFRLSTTAPVRRKAHDWRTSENTRNQRQGSLISTRDVGMLYSVCCMAGPDRYSREGRAMPGEQTSKFRREQVLLLGWRGSAMPFTTRP